MSTLARVRDKLGEVPALRWLSPVDAAAFALSLVTFLYVVPFGDFDRIIGDNIAQVGYWRVLFHRHLVGAIGASSMKPGLMLLLGVAHDVSVALLDSTILIQVVFAMFAAGLVAVVVRIARDAGGLIAGAGAAVYLITATRVPEMYTQGTSMIVFLPLLFWGIWLFSRGHERSGALVLCLATTIRIEALGVLGWLSVSEQLLRRRYRPFVFTCVVTALTIVLTAATYYAVQGSMARFNAGGPPCGYLFSRDPNAWSRFVSTLKYSGTASYKVLFKHCGYPYFAVAALIGFVLNPMRRYYAALLGILLFLNVYIATGSGSPEVRYLEFWMPFAAAFGAAGLAACFRMQEFASSRWAQVLGVLLVAAGIAVTWLDIPSELFASITLVFVAAGASVIGKELLSPVSPRLVPFAWSVFLGLAILFGLRDTRWPRILRVAPHTVDAFELLHQRHVPRGSRVMTEDDIIYGVVVKDHGFFESALALQYFNIQSDERRAAMLANVDYVVVSKRKWSWYFLKYDPEGRGSNDPFRAALDALAGPAGAPVVYGHRLTPVENNDDWIILKVERANG